MFTRKNIIQKIKQIAKGITNVKNKYIPEKGLVLDYVTIFAQTDAEFKELVRTSKKLGTQIDEHNGPVFKFHTPLEFENGVLKIFRIRKPDPERPQIGCGDFKVPDYKKFKKKYLHSKFFIFVSSEGFEYLGIHDPKEDYYVYFPDITLTEELGL